MNPTAWLELGLALLPKIEVGVTEFIAWLGKLRFAAMQDQEWTPDQEEAWRAALLAKNVNPEELPDA